MAAANWQQNGQTAAGMHVLQQLAASLDRNTAVLNAVASNQKESITGNPAAILRSLDTGLARVAQEQRKAIQKRLNALDHHWKVLQKYQGNTLQKLFQSEADHPWQFPDEYKAEPKATDHEAPDIDSSCYDIDAAWKHLRLQAFLRQHSEAIMASYQKKLQPDSLVAETNLRLEAFYRSREGQHYTTEEQNYFAKRVRDYIWLTRRQLLSTSGYAKLLIEDKEQKRKAALTEATALYNAADLRTLLALAKYSVNTDGTQRRYTEGSLMHYLYSDRDDASEQDDVLTDILKKIKEGKLPKPYQKPSTSNPKARSTSRKRSSSNRSAKSNQSGKTGRTNRFNKHGKNTKPGKPNTTQPKARSSSARRSRGRSPPAKGILRARSSAPARRPSPKGTQSRQRSSSQQKTVSFKGRWAKKRQG
eukprot:TRINITY_DN38665_c0_g1_i1.p1 TRINITY_DN38665_c0_g1~~TRINITY_DN38665_c0_g1_i1.p1  ORF type:complete len:418 (-),score=56.78 TRINITY_DN38665_c0_g1_i1:681-1934(-)